jgi:hypothetical protein
MPELSKVKKIIVLEQKNSLALFLRFKKTFMLVVFCEAENTLFFSPAKVETGSQIFRKD